MKLLPAETSASLINAAHHSDLFDLCERVHRAGVRVDMILCDLPYAVTGISWDKLIPMTPMWSAFRRIIRPRGAIVLTAIQPFTSMLTMSNLEMFRYEWVWIKTHSPHFLNADNRPLGIHESALVFSDGSHDYFPQMTPGKHKNRSGEKSNLERNHSNFGFDTANLKKITVDEYYPKTALFFNSVQREGMLHPTQKPVDLFRYLIRTYTQPNQLVFDPCVGSGTTAIAAREEGRRFICGDSSLEYVEVARKRLAAPYTPSFMPMLEQTA